MGLVVGTIEEAEVHLRSWLEDKDDTGVEVVERREVVDEDDREWIFTARKNGWLAKYFVHTHGMVIEWHWPGRGGRQ